MERCTVRFGLVAVSAGACLVAVTGCETLGLRKADGPDKKQPAFYDEFLESDEVAEATSERPPSIFKRNRLPGGLSEEARAIERDTFNIY